MTARRSLLTLAFLLFAAPAWAQYTPGCVIVATSATTIGCSTQMIEDSEGVAINTLTPSGRLDSHHTFTETTGERNNVFLYSSVEPTGHSTASLYTLHAHLDVPSWVTSNLGVLTTGLFDPHHYGSGYTNVYQAVEGSPSAMAGTLGYLRGGRFTISAQGAHVISGEALSAQVQSVNGGSISNAYGLKVYGGNGSSGIVTAYGARVEALAGVYRWSFYADADEAYFGGGVRLVGDLVRPLEPNGYACWSNGRLVSSQGAC